VEERGRRKDRGHGDENEKDRSRASRTRAKLQLKRRAAMPSQKKTNSLRKTALATGFGFNYHGATFGGTAERSTPQVFCSEGPQQEGIMPVRISTTSNKIRHMRKKVRVPAQQPEWQVDVEFPACQREGVWMNRCIAWWFW